MNHSVRKKLVYFSMAISSLLFLLTQCAKSEFQEASFAPSSAQAKIKGITSNGTSSLYCSISGGCSVSIVGSDFYKDAKVFIGPYECTGAVISADHTTIDCTAGAGKSGVFAISVVNADGKASVFDSTVSNPALLNFSYASFLYLGVQDNPGTVYGYAQNPVTGALLPIPGSPFSIATNASNSYGTAISPNNKFLYAANYGSNSISIYSINAIDGRLTAVTAAMPAGIGSASGLFFHPSGRYLYLTSFSSAQIAGFNVAADGTLTAIAGSPFSTGAATNMSMVVVHSSGNFLYASGVNGVAGMAINATDGSLTPLAGSPFQNSNGGFTNSGDGITIHPNGRWLYMGLYNQSRVAAFQIDKLTGTLTPIGTPILNNSTTGYSDNGGSGANISPDGLFFYGTAFSKDGLQPKKIITYSIDQSTGDLSLSSEADAGGGPNDVRVDTNGIFAYTCNSMNPPSVSAYRRNANTGALTPLSPRDVAIPTGNGGPGIMVIQR